MRNLCTSKYPKLPNKQLFKWVRDIEESGKSATGADGANVARTYDATGAGGAIMAHSNGDTASCHRESQVIALQVGSSARVVERIRTILRHASQEVIEMVDNGTMSINQAYNVVIGKQKIKRIPLAQILRSFFIDTSVYKSGYGTALYGKEIQILAYLAQHMAIEHYLSKAEFKEFLECIYSADVSQIPCELLEGVEKKAYVIKYR